MSATKVGLSNPEMLVFFLCLEYMNMLNFIANLYMCMVQAHHFIKTDLTGPSKGFVNTQNKPVCHV